MNILFLTENFPPEVNASATRVFERACYWVEWGHKVTVITCAPNFPTGQVYEGYHNDWYRTEDMRGIRVVRVKTYIAKNEGVAKRTADFVSYMFTAVAAGLFQQRPDVVVATSPQFFAAVGGWMLSGLRRVPFVFELGDLWPASIMAVGAMRKNLFLRWMERLELFLYRRSAAVVALTRSFKEDLVFRAIPADKIAVVINGVDLPRYSPRARDPELANELGIGDRFVVGYIGTHGMAHGLDNVIRAADLLRDDDRVRFLFVGTGAAKEQLQADAQRLRLSNVIFVPARPKDEMPRYWSLCSMALIHLKDDPVFAGVIPSKMFEAMGMGLPLLIVSPEGEASRIVVGENAGVWVPAARPEVLAETVKMLASSPDRVRELATSSYAASPSYTREKQAQDMLAVLENVIQGHGHEAGSELERMQAAGRRSPAASAD